MPKRRRTELKQITVLVAEDARTSRRRPRSSAPADRLEGSVPDWLKDQAAKLVKPKKISVDKIRTEMARFEREIDGLLAMISTRTAGGYDLTQVQIMVGVSGQGSIAVVT